MGRLIIKGFLLLAAVAATCWYIFSLNPLTGGNQHDYMAAMIDKHRRLDSLASPKLVLVGASNLAFGMNSKLIEDSLGIPVVNMGLHGGLGLAFILNEGRSGIHQGDIVVVSIEYYVGVKGDPQLVKRTIDLYPPAARYVPTGGIEKYIRRIVYPDLLSAYIKRIQSTILEGIPKSLAGAPNWGYRRELFSAYGDVVGELNMPRPQELKDSNIGNHDYSEGIQELNDYASYVRSQGARIYFAYPDYAESAYKKNKGAIYFLVDQYRRSLSIPIINTPEDFVFPDSFFIDTVFHLTKEGREKRTLKLISILKEKVFGHPEGSSG